VGFLYPLKDFIGFSIVFPKFVLINVVVFCSHYGMKIKYLNAEKTTLIKKLF